MPGTTNYDLFISHAWRNHDSWIKIVDLLDGQANFSWRNFSVPWHDPAKHPSTPDGAKFIRDWLKSQIRPVAAVIVLADVYEVRSARKWLEFEIEYARELGIPIIIVAPEGDSRVEGRYENLGGCVVEWDVEKLIDAIRTVVARSETSIER